MPGDLVSSIVVCLYYIKHLAFSNQHLAVLCNPILPTFNIINYLLSIYIY
jgi:hypothetical protein